ncbi:MAG: NB-ARC domain-containing protein [Anaerolineae bacterium]
MTELSLSKLQADITQALKAWHRPGAEASPLDYLQIFQQASGGNPRQTTNEILLDALQALAAEHTEEAELLRLRFLDGMVMHAVANRLNIGEATAYRRQKEAIRQLALILQTREAQARAERRAILEGRLPPPTYVELFGVEGYLAELRGVIASPEPPWLVSIEGMGGIGKTALADALARQIIDRGVFDDLGWVSAKQQDFVPGLGLEQRDGPAFNEEALIDALLEQFGPAAALAQPPAQKKLALVDLLKKAPHLVVLDNLETAADYQRLLPLLRQLAGPGKFLLTSRHSLQAHPDVFCLNLGELGQADTLRLIRYEANLRRINALERASDAQLELIYRVVGGNPLALKLVMGQMAVLSLSQVLENLRQARGKPIEELYTYIYWQAWHMLDAAGRQTLLVMPLVQDGSLDQLQVLSQLEIDDLSRTLEQLATLSLVQVSGDLEARRYTIHRLTETFLLNEAIQWQMPR